MNSTTNEHLYNVLAAFKSLFWVCIKASEGSQCWCAPTWYVLELYKRMLVRKYTIPTIFSYGFLVVVVPFNVRLCQMLTVQRHIQWHHPDPTKKSRTLSGAVIWRVQWGSMWCNKRMPVFEVFRARTSGRQSGTSKYTMWVNRIPWFRNIL